MMHGHFTDARPPKGTDMPGYALNSQGYRCPEWEPMPDGKKNVVVLGCSHTFGQGNADDEHWVHFLSQHNTDRLRYWNMAQPGASGDKVVRILYGCEKIINPRIVIVCWPFWGRRERLGLVPEDVMAHDGSLRGEDEHTDRNNFLRNVFWVEKYAERNRCQTYHCFAQESYHEHLRGLNVLEGYTIANCWPHWDKFTARDLHARPDLARDGEHYGVRHHMRFASLFLQRFANKLK